MFLAAVKPTKGPQKVEIIVVIGFTGTSKRFWTSHFRDWERRFACYKTCFGARSGIRQARKTELKPIRWLPQTIAQPRNSHFFAAFKARTTWKITFGSTCLVSRNLENQCFANAGGAWLSWKTCFSKSQAAPAALKNIVCDRFAIRITPNETERNKKHRLAWPETPFHNPPPNAQGRKERRPSAFTMWEKPKGT